MMLRVCPPSRLAARYGKPIATTLVLLLRTALQAGAFIIIARMLGAADYGAFVAVVSLAAIFAPFATVGFEIVLLRAVAVDRTLLPSAFTTGIRLIAGFGSALVLVGMIADHILELVPVTLLCLGSVLVSDLLFSPCIELSSRAFQAIDEAVKAALLRVLQAALRFGAALTLSMIGGAGRLELWALLYASASAIAATLSIVIVLKSSGVARARRAHSWGGLNFGGWFALNGVTERANNDADKIMMARLASLPEAGAYSAAYRFMELALVPVGALLMNASAGTFRAGAGGFARAHFRQLLVPLTVYGAFAAVGLFAVAPLLPVLLGRQFETGIRIVQAFALFPVLHAWRHALTQALMSIDAMRFVSAMQVCAATLTVVLNLALIPRFGWLGALVVTLFVEAIVAFVFAVVLVKRTAAQSRCTTRRSDSASL